MVFFFLLDYFGEQGLEIRVEACIDLTELVLGFLLLTCLLKFDLEPSGLVFIGENPLY